MAGIITEYEMEMARFCIERAKELGASASRVSLSKNILDSVTFFNEDNLAEAIEWVKRNCPIGVFVSSNQQFTAQPISFVN